MNARTFAVSDVERETEPLDEVPYYQAIRSLLGLPSLDEKQQLRIRIEEIDSYRELPEHIDERLAESKQNLALAIASEVTADVFLKESPRQKIQLYKNQVEIFGQILANRDDHRALRALHKLKFAQKLAELEARDPMSMGALESCSRYYGRLVKAGQMHPFLAALSDAFHMHRPLCISPDMIWLILCQGVAQHVNLHAEKLRSKFVKHAGKVLIEVRRDDFIKGSPENPWGEAIDELCQKVKEHIGSIHDLFIPNFSTTGRTERIAAEVVLLDALQSYFEYVFVGLCGIPAITLEGTVEDWQALADRAEAFAEFDLEWWLAPLRRILQELIAAANGNVRRKFWESIYDYESAESCGGGVNGWIVSLFPYLKDNKGCATIRNPWMEEENAKLDRLMGLERLHGPFNWQGPSAEAFPSGLARAPFVWNYREQQYNMELLSGFVGVAQDASTLTLRPEIGWAVWQVPKIDKAVFEEPFDDLANLPSPEQTPFSSTLDIYDSLGDERTNVKCKRGNCTRGAVKYSVFCRTHHYESLHREPCPFTH